MGKTIKPTSLGDRIKEAITALRGKPHHSMTLGVEVKRCSECDREEVRTGYNLADKVDGEWFKCSECGYGMNDWYSEDESQMPNNELQYCPNCGARMEGKR